MGLDTSHDCWHGSYGAFNRWREMIARVSEFPPLPLMEGFFEKGSHLDTFKDYAERYENLGSIYYDSLPIKWESLKPSPLHILLHHSDCDGELRWQDCGAIALELEKLMPKLPKSEAGGHIGNWRDKTQTFIDGLREAEAAKENVDFH